MGVKFINLRRGGGEERERIKNSHKSELAYLFHLQCLDFNVIVVLYYLWLYIQGII